NPAELVNHGAAAEDGMVLDSDMTRERHHVGQYGMAADLRIMRHVDIGHDPVVVANARHPQVLHRSGIQRAEFTNDVVVADLQACWLAILFLVLRIAADDGMLVDAVVAADAGMAGYNSVRSNGRVVA